MWVKRRGDCLDAALWYEHRLNIIDSDCYRLEKNSDLAMWQYRRCILLPRIVFITTVSIIYQSIWQNMLPQEYDRNQDIFSSLDKLRARCRSGETPEVCQIFRARIFCLPKKNKKHYICRVKQ